MSMHRPLAHSFTAANLSRGALAASFVSLAWLAAAPAAAHEFWIEPGSFAPRSGETVELRLFVGDGFGRGKAYARNPRHLRSFFAAGAERTAVPGGAGADPAGRIVVHDPGALIAAYESHPSTITLEADRFESYLRDEGLEHVIATRAELGETALPGREAFSRAAKTLLTVRESSGGEPAADGGFDSGFDRSLGLAVEIVPLNEPRRLSRDDRLEVLVLRRGEPLADAQVRIFSKSRPQATRKVRTDDAGRAAIRLEHPDTWMLSVVHMERAPAGSGVDWLSTWSSLTFTNRRSPLAVATANPTTQEQAE